METSSLLFITTTFLTLYLFYRATGRKLLAVVISLAWLLLQMVISLGGIYQVTSGFPPRFLLLVLPPIVLITLLFITPSGRGFIDNSKPGALVLIHTTRVLVELILFSLYLSHLVPQVMTFEGRNFDVLSGLTAPLIWYFGYQRRILPRSVLLGWNILCLMLLLNIVITAVLSAPFPFQQLAFDQPNIAILRFPYVWLPGFIVPVVLFAHLASIKQLLNAGKER